MGIPEDEAAEKLSKPEKHEQKKLDVAADRIEEYVTEKNYTKLCVSVIIFLNALIFVGVLFLTKNTFAIILVVVYIIVITLIALVPFIMNEYEQVGRKPPTIVRWANSFLKKLLPMDRTIMRMGPAILVGYLYLATIGGFIAIGIYTFADFLSGNPAIYDYLYGSGSTMDYGFFSFLENSSSASLIPSILWYLIIFIPVIFCILFVIAALYYRNNNESRILSLVIVSPLVVLLPLFLTASSITSPSIVIAFIFLAAWGVTIVIWYRDFTKRNAMVTLSIFFTQVLASFLIIYAFIFREVRDISAHPAAIDIAPYFNPLFLLIWFGVLVTIPTIIKGFDIILKGKIKIIGVLLTVGIVVVFQFYFFNLFSQSIYDSYSPIFLLEDAQIYIASGFFFFYANLLLIPLFFIFGYFQIGLVRWLYRSIRDYGQKATHPGLFRFLSILLASLSIIGLVVFYYVFLYSAEDYQNMFFQVTWLFNGNLIYYITNPGAYPYTLINVYDALEIISLAITMGLLFYSSYRAAYNLALFSDQIEDPHKNIKRLGIFNFIIFTSPRSYKTRILFGISLIFVFLGISTIFAFLRIHSYLFYFSSQRISYLLFTTFDGLKLAISIIGMCIAIGIFFYFIYKRRQIEAGY